MIAGTAGSIAESEAFFQGPSLPRVNYKKEGPRRAGVTNREGHDGR